MKFACTALLMAATAMPWVPALAQQVLAPPSATDPAHSEHSNDIIPDIIVTARRVNERLQDVPISVSVYNTQQIADRNIKGVEDVVLYTPSVSLGFVSVLGRDTATFAIRGFDQPYSTTAATGVYFADVVAPRAGPGISAGDGAGPGSLFDLQSIQILKGPQGTLFGRNTTGGAVLLTPVRPGSSFDGYLEAMGGSYDWIGLQGAINIPVTNNLRARLSVDFQKRNGFTTAVGKDAETGAPFRTDLDDRNYVAARASIVWDVTPSLENYTILSFVRSRPHGSSQPIIGCSPLVALGYFACGPGGDNSYQAQQAAGARVALSDLSNPQMKTDQQGIINTTTWHPSETLTLKNIFGFNHLETSTRAAVFSTDINFANQGPHLIFDDYSALNGQTPINNENTISDELQLQGKSLGGTLTWQGGLYYETSVPAGPSGERAVSVLNCQNWDGPVAGLRCMDVLGGGTPGTEVGTIEDRLNQITYRDEAVYAQATFKFSDHWRFTGGARYTWDQVNASGALADYHFSNTTFSAPLDIQCTIPGQVYDPSVGVASCLKYYKYRSSAPTGTASLEFTPSDSVMVYAKYSRGYRQGNVGTENRYPYEVDAPEFVNAYELGEKATFRVGGVPVQVNSALFYNNFSNMQVEAQINIVGQGRGAAIVNAGSAVIYGAELGTIIRLTPRLELDADYTYLHTELKSIIPPTLPPGSPPGSAIAVAARVGGPLPAAPPHKASIALTYQIPTAPNFGEVKLGVTGVYVSKQVVGNTELNPFATMPAYAVMNLNLDWAGIFGGPLDLDIFATNVLNKTYINYDSNSNSAGTTGFELGRYGEPRMVGAKVRYHF